MAILNYLLLQLCWWPFTTLMTTNRFSIKAFTTSPLLKTRLKADASWRWVSLAIPKVKKRNFFVDAVLFVVKMSTIDYAFEIISVRVLTAEANTHKERKAFFSERIFLDLQFTYYVHSSSYFLPRSENDTRTAHNRRMINGFLLQYSCTFFSV